MSELEARRKSIREQWKLTTQSGVDVYPLIAAVNEMENRGFAMLAARELLAKAKEQYRGECWDQLLVTAALVNREIHTALQQADRGVTTFRDYVATLADPVMPAAPCSCPGSYAERVKGSWVGKCIGVALGDPLEGWTADMIRSRYGWVSDYVTIPSIANDDTAYQILVLHALDEHGEAFTSQDLALQWVEHLPHAFTAEWTALENVKAGIMPPECGWFRNPCAEWVGAQMRSEVFGLLAPLRPELAAQLAFRDAIISHRGEGLHGGVFGAVLVSLSFLGLGVEELLRLSLSWVPPRSRFRQLVEETMYWCTKHGSLERVIPEIQREVASYHWIHTLPNIAAVVAGLCLGEGDFHRSMLNTLHCGFDTDCSTGQTAALLGALLGYDRIPEHWSVPIGDSFESYVLGYERMSFDALTAWTTEWGHRLETAEVGEMDAHTTHIDDSSSRGDETS